ELPTKPTGKGGVHARGTLLQDAPLDEAYLLMHGRSLPKSANPKGYAGLVAGARSPERYGFTRRSNGEAKRTQGRQVSYACSAFVTRCIEAMLRASWKKTVG